MSRNVIINLIETINIFHILFSPYEFSLYTHPTENPYIKLERYDQMMDDARFSY